MKKILFLSAICVLPLLTLGCSEGGNEVVEPADDAAFEEEMQEMQSQFEAGAGGGGKGIKP